MSLLELNQGTKVCDFVEIAEDAFEDWVQTLQHAKLLLQLGDLGYLQGNLVDPVRDLLSLLGGFLALQ